MISFVMGRDGDYAVYERGQYTGFGINRNGGDIFPTYVYYGGSQLTTVDSLEAAKDYIRKALA